MKENTLMAVISAVCCAIAIASVGLYLLEASYG